MMAIERVMLGELMAPKAGSVDPSKFPEEIFDLYSIPAFDTGKPEIVDGGSIGSTKQVVKPGDVLLSKIVPHIRRSWVVSNGHGRRLIASGEWIVFRSHRIEPKYLRHVLVSDPFHSQFMSTVSGVGGSLLRARPAYVATIEIPLPPLSEQRRLAEVLDRAEALRVKRGATLAQLNVLTQALFLDMFGDPATNPRGWPRASLERLLASGPQNGLYKPASDYGSGTPILRIDAFYNGVVKKLDRLRRVQLSHAEVNQYGLRPNDIVVNRVNSMAYLGKSALIPELAEATVFESNMMRFSVDHTIVVPTYVVRFLQTPFVRSQVHSAAKHAVNQSSINQLDVKALQINVPPLPLQREFTNRAAAVERLKNVQRASLVELDALFASLQDRAFRGEL